jgi:DNA-binding CsgD family transcriptional regulator
MSEKEREEQEFTYRLYRVGWGRADPDFRRVFTSEFIPGGTEEQMRWFDEMQQVSASSAMAERMARARGRIDVSGDVKRITVPTLVMHLDDDHAVRFDRGRELAATIPGARFAALEGRDHVILANDAAWPRFLAEIDAFVPGTATHGESDASAATLTERERDVLRLVAAGRSNEDIAAELSLSVRTVERHLGNVYTKLGISGRSARAAAAARYAGLAERERHG